MLRVSRGTKIFKTIDIFYKKMHNQSFVICNPMEKQPRGTNKEIGLIFWQHTLKYKKAAFFAFSSVVIYNIAQLAAPWLYRSFFNILVQNPEDSFKKLTFVLFQILIIYIISQLFRRISNFSNIYVQAQVMSDLVRTAESYLLKHSQQFFMNSFAGTLVRRVNKFSRAYEDISDKLVFNVLPLLISILVILPVLYFRSIILGLILTIWIGIFVFLSYYFAKWKQKYDIARSEKDSESTGVLADIISNSSSVELFASYKQEESRYKKVTEELAQMRLFSWRLNEKMDAVHAIFATVTEIGVMYVAILLWQKGALTIGDFALIQAYFIVLLNRVWDLGNVIRRFYEAMSDAAEIVGILKTGHDIQDVKNAPPINIDEGKIEFINVNFSYHRTRPILRSFNLTIEPGEHVAFVGPSGAGKSTITKLILRLYDVGHGRIRIDEQNIAYVQQNSLREQIALVPQEPTLFHRTLFENIQYGRGDATEKEIFEAAKKANCDEFIRDLPDGYKTYVGERGVKLSGGERQRVVIARALLKDAPILLLDEATSSLDSESEALIQDALKNLMKNRTTVVIAHRLSTIMQMDRIVVVEHGQVVDSGTHDELLHREGTYKKLLDIQAGGFIP
ncbi:ABC transporter ATP-binding protein [Candidatus Uhrbacteria bacterium CG10_big_fil_rev_8_21_14_0_10_48_11]|uniref:ABC transporter ATP-binding protein n=1 Tax=Candidatus Uhrbacteria bacterium CG10_big_fil_rev_8_21_14_0_10_48_11 TaxID=1975037 RepID=A0A2M8LEN2_9BACT|nr:MAG: ABC transporter ATP-binding protein [Candidatus Uhrbacteria bacterium CG10_big_fil_rev_8_21_14_0_10_48_11]